MLLNLMRTLTGVGAVPHIDSKFQPNQDFTTGYTLWSQPRDPTLAVPVVSDSLHHTTLKICAKNSVCVMTFNQTDCGIFTAKVVTGSKKGKMYLTGTKTTVDSVTTEIKKSQITSARHLAPVTVPVESLRPTTS